jgi:hypothetical protein
MATGYQALARLFSEVSDADRVAILGELNADDIDGVLGSAHNHGSEAVQ